MNCPKDNTPLAHLGVERNFQNDIHLDVCNTCNGIWVDGDEVEALFAHLSSDYQKTYKKWLTANSDGTTAPKDFWQESNRVCPKDGFILKKHFIGAAHSVGVEQCPACTGFWFDGDELHAVAEANTPNPRLDNAIVGAAAGLREELNDNYNPDVVEFWDGVMTPKKVLPLLQRILFIFMATFITKK